MGFADFHIHTIYSCDETAAILSVLQRAKRIDAVTDHDEICGALQAQQLAPQFNIQVIPGVEITTTEGDLPELFIRQITPAHLGMTLV